MVIGPTDDDVRGVALRGGIIYLKKNWTQRFGFDNLIIYNLINFTSTQRERSERWEFETQQESMVDRETSHKNKQEHGTTVRAFDRIWFREIAKQRNDFVCIVKTTNQPNSG